MRCCSSRRRRCCCCYVVTRLLTNVQYPYSWRTPATTSSSCLPGPAERNISFSSPSGINTVLTHTHTRARTHAQAELRQVECHWCERIVFLSSRVGSSPSHLHTRPMTHRQTDRPTDRWRAFYLQVPTPRMMIVLLFCKPSARCQHVSTREKMPFLASDRETLFPPKNLPLNARTWRL